MKFLKKNMCIRKKFEVEVDSTSKLYVIFMDFDGLIKELEWQRLTDFDYHISLNSFFDNFVNLRVVKF